MFLKAMVNDQEAATGVRPQPIAKRTMASTGAIALGHPLGATAIDENGAAQCRHGAGDPVHRDRHGRVNKLFLFLFNSLMVAWPN